MNKKIIFTKFLNLKNYNLKLICFINNNIYNDK